MTAQLIAYHNKESVRQKFLKRVNAHYKADEIIHGTYWEDGKGCCIGCGAHAQDGAHEVLEKEAGFPLMVSYLADKIFEGLDNGASKKFVPEFYGAVKVGVDLSLVGWKFQLWLQVENHKFAVKEKMPADVISAIKSVVDLLKPASEGEPINKSAWSARSAAESAWSARSAAESAWSAWSAWSARSAAESARSAAESARSAAESAWSARSAAESARSAAWERMAAKLLELIQDAPKAKRKKAA